MLIIMKEIIAIAMIGPCGMSGPSPKFFGVCSKFSDVPLFRPNLFIKDDSRTRAGGIPSSNYPKSLLSW